MRLEHRARAEWILGAIGGLYGGISGVWGPPLLVYLLSIKADKLETVRAQGVVFLIGAVVLLAAHLTSGVLNSADAGLFGGAGGPGPDRARFGVRGCRTGWTRPAFRRWTQVLLVLTGLNLMRRVVW